MSGETSPLPPGPALNVCHFAASSVEGGYFAVHARAILQRGGRALFVSLGDSAPPTWRERVPEAMFLSLGARARWQYPLALARLAAYLRQQKVDVLQTHLFDATVLGVAAARLAGVPLVVMVRHHLDDAILAGARVQDAVERAVARFADVIIAPSDAVKRHLVEHDGHPEEKVERIYHGWDFSRFQATSADAERVRRDLGVAPEDFMLGFVGRFTANKGHVYLLRAVAQLAPRIPNIRLLLLGEGDQAAVRREIALLGLENRVIISGWRPDPLACMRAMDVMVHPSLSEAFCQVIIEGMGMGRPMISTDVGGAPEAIDSGVNGVLIPTRDVQAIVDAVWRLHQDPAHRAALASAGQASVRRMFTGEQMVAAHFRLYDRLLADGRRARRMVGDARREAPRRPSA